MLATRLFASAAILAFASFTQAQSLEYATLPNSPAYEAAAKTLREVPPSEYRFDQARLSDVLQLLAEEAGMSFFSLPEDSEEGERVVTFTIHASPFVALETLAKANGIALIFENGIWYLRPENDTHLIGRVYQIKYNAREMVSSQGNSGGLGAVSQGTGGGAGGGGSVSLPDTTTSFEVEPSQLLEDIRELLDIPTTTNVVFAGSTSVDQFGVGSGGASQLLIPSTIEGPGAAQGQAAEEESSSSAKVIWNSDSNTLYVVATRQQHQWIEGYLAASDTPQSQIGIEVKFIETSKDPRLDLGVDWTPTLGDGYDISLSGDGGAGSAASSATGGTDAGLGPIAGPIDLSDIGSYTLPTTAIMSYEAVSLKLQALASDTKTKNVSYPRVLTTNNREVMIRSVINQPVLSASSATSLGAGATTTQSVSYLPIGTVLNILPKELGNGQIQMHIAITISSIIGETIIDGNPYPIASSRVYNAPVECGSGYTIAIGGLDEAQSSQTESGIPLLKDIPGLGFAFKGNNSRNQRTHLMIMITPTLLDPTKGGLPDEPQAVVRTTPFDPAPPMIYDDGSLVQNVEQLHGAINSMRRECQILQKRFDEYTADEIHKESIEALLLATQLTRGKLQSWTETYPDRRKEFIAYDQQLAGYEGQLLKLQKTAKWMRF